ncbi:TPA: phage baseplate assembly protein V [Escherichia coli]|nr:phage baseplate assembly protein V [Escherichia coli]
MLKPDSLRRALTDAVTVLKTNPDMLRIFVDNGSIASTLAASLSFEKRYTLNVIVTDFTGDFDLLIVPVLAWLRELARALRNMIRTGIIVETDLNAGRCRVQTGGMCSDWLQWLTHRAGRSRTWWAPSVGEQVLILAVGGELDTAFVLPGIYSGDNPAPSASADALHIRFPDGAVIEYEPETSALTVSGIKTASVTASDSVTATVPVVMVKASTRVTLDTPEVVCTNRLITGTLEVQKGGTMRGNIEHTGGELSSNGKVLHTHKHPGDSGGTTGGPL